MKFFISLAIAALLFSCGSDPAPDNGGDTGTTGTVAQREKIVNRIDHLLVRTDQVNPLFDLFKNTFNLPVAWEVADYGSFSSGGLYFGNTTVEFLTFNNETNTFLHGIAFEPATTAAAARTAMTNAGIACGNVVAGSQWSTVNIDGPFDLAGEIFICDYNFDNTAAQGLLNQALVARNGGLIGLQNVRETVIRTTGLAAAVSNWNALLYPLTNSGAVWTTAAGPDIRLETGPTDGLFRITLRVASLVTATNALATNGMLAIEGGSFFITNTILQELLFEVVE